MIKIAFTCGWTSDKDITNRVINNFITEENKSDDITITNGDDYDYLFCFNRLNREPKVPKNQIFTFIMEPSWSPNWDRNSFIYSNKVFTHDKNLFGNYDNIAEHPSLMFYHMNSDKNNIRKLMNDHSFDHKKNMSMVVSYTPRGNYNYELRTKLALKILEYNLDVDIYGNGWSTNHKNIKGTVIDKYDALYNYKFSIGVENCCEKNYITEKFFDIPLCNAMPIYYGAPNINEVYNNYIPIDITNIENALDTISDILKNDNVYDYEKVFENKKIYYEKYNLYHIIKQLINVNN
jgi:hypothetical protein